MKWEEVERALKKKDASLLVFEAPQVLQRVEKMGDLFAPVLKLKQKLPKLAGAGKTEAIEQGLDLAAQADKTEKPAARKAKPEAEVRAATETQTDIIGVLTGQLTLTAVDHKSLALSC